jgi:ribose 5-phosphate isomerase A
VHNLNILNAIALEQEINNIAGVVCNGLFARQGADLALLAGPNGVREVTRQV